MPDDREDDTPKKIESIDDLHPGDHICCIYETDRQHRELLAPFIRAGLVQNDRVIYIVDERTEGNLLGYLKEEGVDPTSFLDRGQLSFLTAEETFLQTGRFESEGMIGFLRFKTEDALRKGYRALRVAGEMSWALRGLPGSERLIEYEAKLNEFIEGSDCVALGLYDSRLFNPRILLNVLSTHPVAVIGTEFLDNFYFIPPEKFFSGQRSAAIYEQWIGSLKSHDLARRELERSERRLQEMFESAAEGVVTTKPDGRYLFANTAAARILGYEDSEQMIGRSAVDHWGTLESRKELLAELEEEGSLRNYETTARRLDGSTFPVRLSAALRKDDDGNPISITTFFNDITELKRKEELDMVRALSAYVVEGMERERKEVAQEIHDQLGQVLSFMKIDLDWLLDNTAGEKREATEKLEELRDHVEEIFGWIRGLVSRLRPVVLDRLGLGAAVEWQIEDFQKHFDIECQIEGDMEDIHLGEEADTVAFRIIQESLTNVARHSGADRVVVSVEQDGADYVFKVSDNGKGIKEQESSGPVSLGILGMRERARAMGGTLSIEGREGEGTVVTLRLPNTQEKYAGSTPIS